MQTCLSCGIELSIMLKGTDGYCKKCDLSQPSATEGISLSNLLTGKSHLGDFGRSIAVFGFYVIMIELTALALARSAIGAGTAGAVYYLAVLGMMVSVPAALIYFGILFFARALNKASLRNVAIVWFFAFPALVILFAISQ